MVLSLVSKPHAVLLILSVCKCFCEWICLTICFNGDSDIVNECICVCLVIILLAGVFDSALMESWVDNEKLPQGGLWKLLFARVTKISDSTDQKDHWCGM